jgi:hypothetical protein
LIGEFNFHGSLPAKNRGLRFQHGPSAPSRAPEQSI